MYSINKKNLYFALGFFVLLLGIIFFLTYMIRDAYREYVNVDDNPSTFIQPQVYPNIISEYETKYILEKSKDNFEDSVILSGYESSIRKSKTCWLTKNDHVVKNIIQRVCNIDNIPFDNAEDLQVVKYQPNGYYNEHYDTCCDDDEACKEETAGAGSVVLDTQHHSRHHMQAAVVVEEE